MRIIAALLVLVSVSAGQWIETTIPLSLDTALTFVGPLAFHAPNNSVYVSGDQDFLVVVDAATRGKTARVSVGGGGHVLCSAPQANKVYCANREATITVIDGTDNQPVKTFATTQTVTDMLYHQQGNKLYCGNGSDTLIRVFDCAGDTPVARIKVRPGPSVLCYSQRLNRVYALCRATSDVVVIDCTADTVVRTVWVRGVEPLDICYDSASNCVYTANSVSNTVSVIDCGADTLLRLLSVGNGPRSIIAGPPGKVYCSNGNDSIVSVICGGTVKSVWTGSRSGPLSYDPVNNKVYCSGGGDSVAVIDAAVDSVIAQAEPGWSPWSLSYDPVHNNTYVACAWSNVVGVIGGESNEVEACLVFGGANSGQGPDLLLCNPTSDRLYCVDNDRGALFVVDCSTNTLRAGLPLSPQRRHDLAWNQLRNKVYVCPNEYGRIGVVDGVTDRVVAQIGARPGGNPTALCYNPVEDKLYAASTGDSIVSVIDCAGDTVVAALDLPGDGGYLAFNNVLNKVYCSGRALAAISGAEDSIVALISLPLRTGELCFVPTGNKLYVGADDDPYIYVVDCVGDTLVRTIETRSSVSHLYYDRASDKVYAAEWSTGSLLIFDAVTDSLLVSRGIGPGMTSALDNGRSGDANRVYCASGPDDELLVIDGETNGYIRGIMVGHYPTSLAWSPGHSWLYVANHDGSDITVVRDTLLLGVEESRPPVSGRKPRPTVVKGVLFLPDASSHKPQAASLMDISGRQVLDMKPGANDVRALAPGVYFVREAQAQAEAQTVRKIVLTE